MDKKVSGESVVKDIRRRTRKKYSSEEKIRIVIDGLRGEDSISNLCRREGIPTNLCYRWSKDFLEAGKKSGLWAIRPEKLAPMKWLTLKKKTNN
jgi:transposase